jgi:hypothetical protein
MIRASSNAFNLMCISSTKTLVNTILEVLLEGDVA